jgi:hypothetical protein
MISFSNVLAWTVLAAQAIAWPAVRLHETAGSLMQLPPADRIIAERLLRGQLGPLFQGEGAAQLNNAIKSFRAERLNLGGTPAIAVQPTGENLCGASGNCAFWIIDLHQRRIVLRADGVQEFAVAPTSKHGFPDVTTETHESAFEHEFIRWQLIGGNYEPAACATENDYGPDGKPLPQPKITPHPCDPEGN